MSITYYFPLFLVLAFGSMVIVIAGWLGTHMVRRLLKNDHQTDEAAKPMAKEQSKAKGKEAAPAPAVQHGRGAAKAILKRATVKAKARVKKEHATSANWDSYESPAYVRMHRTF
ncbi:MAG: hypothetical protein E7K47_00545 [Acidovorax sp.]|nr:hypothetical protein [Acidovorax sp.]TFI42378.1 hypothetical protein E4O93_22405 [Diaphorobacter sp. DS2]